MRQLRRLTDTPSEPYLLDAALSHLRLTDSAEVPLLLQYLGAAREVVESLTGRAILPQTYELAVGDWPDSGVIELGRNPVTSITSVTYLDEDDATQTVAAGDYVLFQPMDAGAFISFRDSFTYPSVSDSPLAVKVTFAAGNATFASVPYSQRQAILYLAAHLYELRTPVNVGNIVNEVPMTLTSLITMNRIGGFVA